MGRSDHFVGVSIATRSLISLYRDVYPELLPKKERGKEATMQLSAGKHTKMVFGQRRVADGIAGTECLPLANESEEEDKEEEMLSISEEELLVSDEDMSEVMSDDSEMEEDEEDATHQSDDNEEEVPELVDIQTTATARKVETTRLLTADEFALLKKRKEHPSLDLGKRSREAETEEEEEEDHCANNDNFVDPAIIEEYRKKRKQNKEERIASIEEGRKEREKFGSRKKGKARASITNKVLLIVIAIDNNIVNNRKNRKRRIF